MTSRPRTTTPQLSGQSRSRPSLVAQVLTAVSLAVAVGLWWVSLPLIVPEDLNDFGLVGILPWPFWAGLMLLQAGFAAGLYLWPRRRLVHLSGLAALVLMLHATPAIVYETLRYSWAWKHIGIIDYIQRHGEVDRTIQFLSAYHNWPGFFWIAASLADLFNLGPTEIADWARFFPVLSNLAYIGFLALLFRRFTDNPQLVFAAIWVFICTSWVGQDYFSPQALAYGLYLLVLILCLGPLMPATATGGWYLGRHLQGLRTAMTLGTSTRTDATPLERNLAVGLLFVAILVMVASHQLTPLILVIALTGLSIVTPLSLGYAILAGLMMLLWVMFPAAPFLKANLAGELDQLGRTVEGVAERLVDTRDVTIGTASVVWVGRALSAGVAVVGGLGGLRRLMWGKRDGVVFVLMCAPVLILGVTSYGGEAIFRIYFFCLPFFAFFCAAFFFPNARYAPGIKTFVCFGLLSLLFSIGFLFANNGKDRQYRFSQDEVEAAVWLYSHDTPSTLLVEVSRNYPSQFMNYEDFFYLPISEEPEASRNEFLLNPGKTLGDWFSDTKWNDGYVIVTRSQLAHVEVSGILSADSLEKLVSDLLASPDLVQVYENQDVRIFRARRFVEG